MLIANLYNFPEKRLPLFAHRAYPQTDTASYPELYEILDAVITSCLETERMERRFGWAVGGRRRELGEFA